MKERWNERGGRDVKAMKWEGRESEREPEKRGEGERGERDEMGGKRV